MRTMLMLMTEMNSERTTNAVSTVYVTQKTIVTNGFAVASGLEHPNVSKSPNSVEVLVRSFVGT